MIIITSSAFLPDYTFHTLTCKTYWQISHLLATDATVCHDLVWMCGVENERAQTETEQGGVFCTHTKYVIIHVMCIFTFE